MFTIGNTYLFLCGDKAIIGTLTHVENGVFALKDAKNVLNWKNRSALRRLATDGVLPSSETRVSKSTTGDSTEFLFSHAIDHAFSCASVCAITLASLERQE
jgi:hypothetical protein